MNKDFVKFISTRAAKLNMNLAEGLPRIHMRNTTSYIKDIFKTAAKGFPTELVFDDIREADPIETYYASLKGRPKHRRSGKKSTAPKISGSKSYDVANTQFYMVYLYFSYINPETGEKIPYEPKPLFLPYLGQGGSLYISDTKWFISTVLTDRVISIGPENIFVRLLRDRLTFSREYFEVKVNGEPRRFDLVHSRIFHHKAKDRSATNAARTTMAHYIFCKYGFTQAMQKYAGTTPMVGEDLEGTLDPAEWNVYTTMGLPPKSMNRRSKMAQNWFSPRIQIGVKKSESNAISQALVAGLFYIASFFPHQVTPEYIDSPDGWVAPLGYMLFSENNNRGDIEKTVYRHLGSIDDYADPIVIANMKSIGIEISDIYDFFAIIASKFSVWIANGQDKVASMYDKELSTLYFVLFDVIKSVFNLNFNLKASNKKQLSYSDVEKAIKENIKPGVCYQISKNHGEASSMSYSGDNMAFKATATLVPQTNTSKQGRQSSGRAAANDPSKRAHPSVAEVAAITCMNKADPSGRSRMNAYMHLDETNTFIVRNPRFDTIMETIARNELHARPTMEGEMVNDIVEDNIIED